MNNPVVKFGRKKSIDLLIVESDTPTHTLKRALGPMSLAALGMGAMLGAGIFVLPGVVAALYAGPGIAVCFLISGSVAFFAALSATELSSAVPIAGSAYTYTYASLGEISAWIVGWLLVLSYGCAGALAVEGWQKYFWSLLDSLALGDLLKDMKFLESLPVTIIILVVLAGLIFGARESLAASNFVVLTAIAIPVIFILVTSGHSQPANLLPFIPPNRGINGMFGWTGILRGSAVLMCAYMGVDAISTTTGEAKNPQRDIPLALVTCIAVVTILYEGVALSLVGTVPYNSLDIADPLAYALKSIGSPRISGLISIGSLVILTWFLRLMMIGLSRILFSFSRDGLLPKALGAIHPRFATPVRSLILSAPLLLLLSRLRVNKLAELLALSLLLLFAIISAGVLYLRVAKPFHVMGFKVPLFPVVPLLAVFMCIILALSLPRNTWLYVAVWLFVGASIYLTYGQKHSTA